MTSRGFSVVFASFSSWPSFVLSLTPGFRPTVPFLQPRAWWRSFDDAPLSQIICFRKSHSRQTGPTMIDNCVVPGPSSSLFWHQESFSTHLHSRTRKPVSIPTQRLLFYRFSSLDLRRSYERTHNMQWLTLISYRKAVLYLWEITPHGRVYQPWGSSTSSWRVFAPILISTMSSLG